MVEGFATESGARLKEFAKQQHDLSSTSGVQDKAVRRGTDLWHSTAKGQLVVNSTGREGGATY